MTRGPQCTSAYLTKYFMALGRVGSTMPCSDTWLTHDRLLSMRQALDLIPSSQHGVGSHRTENDLVSILPERRTGVFRHHARTIS